MISKSQAEAREAAVACANEACRNMDGELDLDAMSRKLDRFAAAQQLARSYTGARTAIDAGLRAFCSETPDFTMSPAMRRAAVDFIMGQPGMFAVAECVTGTDGQQADGHFEGGVWKLSRDGQMEMVVPPIWMPAPLAGCAVRSSTPDEQSIAEVSSDGDEKAFNRGVLIAAATLINHWGAGTEVEHLLGMVNANAEMVESMDFLDYDRVPLLAAIARMAEQDAAQ